MTIREMLQIYGYARVPLLTAEESETARLLLSPVIEQQAAPLNTVSAHECLRDVQTKTDALVNSLGFAGAYLMGTICVNKLPREEARPWHDDWRWWHLAVSHRPKPVQIGVIVYFRDATPENGCLRVTPRSHLFPPIEANALDVTALAGEAVVIDARLWHATHANDTDEHREAVNFWYQVDQDFDREKPMGPARKAGIISS